MGTLKLTIVAAAAAIAAGSALAEEDPYLWMEEIQGAKALAWAKKENDRSLPILEADPRFAPMKEEALSILTSKARIPFGSIHNGAVYNFWQDDEHVRGLWRRAGVESYKSGAPEWETLIDYDALADAEGKNWVAENISCLSPEYRHCMVQLSDGGKDAAFWREYDTTAKSFVDGGFSLAEAKSNVAWIDENTLLVGTDRGEGTLTESGYARTLIRLGRRAALKTAPVFFEGEAKDVSVFPRVEHDGDVAHVFAQRAVSFFETEYYYSEGGADEKAKLPVPLNADLQGVLDGRAIFFLREPWAYQNVTFPQGSVVAYDLAAGAAELILAAADNQSIEDVEVGKSNLVIVYLEDVSGKAARLTRKNKKGSWTVKEIPLPANGVVKNTSAGGGVDDALFSFESLTTPQSLYYVTAKNKTSKVMSMPEFFDASDVVVEQRFATSPDSVRIPYYIMAKKSVLDAGDAPTMQYAYGGFLNPTLPLYYEDPSRPQHGALAGKLWISRGGVLVLSNIRGGSEYGPRWHQAALKENRQKAFDDFMAISQELIASGVTSAEKLGAIGRSNGGLLMGVIMTQKPELYGAIVNGVPLFDMKRLKKIGAGASWVGEYGDPETDDWKNFMAAYSPYQNLKKGKPYPTVFLYTATADDRVHPAHARKAGARLRDLGYEFYYYENMEGGHSGASNQDQLAYRIALEYAYFAKMLMK
ncbi:MAG: prolyl oligopeptidase family serine peptidase [Parvularculaceae bacterium]